MEENSKKLWMVIAEDGDGKIHIFHKYCDEREWVDEFDQYNGGGVLWNQVEELPGHNLTSIATFRLEDIIEVAGL